MANRSTTFTGIAFENPFLLSSAPPTESESNILRAFEAGWGGVVTKTIGLHPVVNVVGAKAKFMRTSPDDAIERGSPGPAQSSPPVGWINPLRTATATAWTRLRAPSFRAATRK